MTLKVNFPETDRDKVLANIKTAMGDRALADLVNFANPPGKLVVTISKLGTSTLEFTEKSLEKSLEYALTSEKIAFTHKAFKDEVTRKIVKVIEKAGGKVT